MSQLQHRLRVKPYTWDPHTNPIPGLVIMSGQYIKAFIPTDQIIDIATAMADVYEAQQKGIDHDRHAA